jgi:hypothetical protein
MKPFCTGSQVYGTPTVESDLDLVVVVSPEDFTLLAQFDPGGPALVYGGAENGQLKFGKLNLICVSEAQAPAWAEATAELAAQKPVTREQAIALIDEKLVKHGQPRRTRVAA